MTGCGRRGRRRSEDGGLRRATWSPAAGCLALRITSLLHTGRVLECLSTTFISRSNWYVVSNVVCQSTSVSKVDTRSKFKLSYNVDPYTFTCRPHAQRVLSQAAAPKFERPRRNNPGCCLADAAIATRRSASLSFPLPLALAAVDARRRRHYLYSVSIKAPNFLLRSPRVSRLSSSSVTHLSLTSEYCSEASSGVSGTPARGGDGGGEGGGEGGGKG